MPYILKGRRNEIDYAMVGAVEIENVGELTYAITLLLWNFYNHNGGRFQQIAEIEGALGCASKEFYRRIASVYEQNKMNENGDVYG